VLGELLTAIVTPFRKDGSVHLERFRAHARHLVENGSDGLVVAATTGEAPTLTDDEKIELWKAAVEEVGEKSTVVAATGTYSTAHSVHLTDQAHELGVDGFLVVTPYYNKPPQRGIVEHFRAIAEVTDKPIMVYNIPGRVVVNIEPATLCVLAQIPNVVAVKQALDDLDQARRIVEEAELELYAGDDFLLFPFLELGGVGGVCVRSNIAGPQMKEMITRHREGDVEAARRINDELQPLWDLDDVAVNPIPVKTALRLLGHDMGGSRLPLVDAIPEEVEQVRVCLERAGLLTAAPA
jgi:4-hydroxy-tetrahydrodipicolinate synthase